MAGMNVCLRVTARIRQFKLHFDGPAVVGRRHLCEWFLS
jgi:hypothetical protein